MNFSFFFSRLLSTVISRMEIKFYTINFSFGRNLWARGRGGEYFSSFFLLFFMFLINFLRFSRCRKARCVVFHFTSDKAFAEQTSSLVFFPSFASMLFIALDDFKKYFLALIFLRNRATRGGGWDFDSFLPCTESFSSLFAFYCGVSVGFIT